MSEKELYENGDCVLFGMLGCRSCPFYNNPLEKENRDYTSTFECYDSFRKYYEKKKVIDYVLKGEK